MIKIKDNLALTADAIKNIIKSPYNTIIVSPALELTAREIFSYFIREVLEFKINEKKISLEKAIKLKLFDFKVIVEIKLKENEWILITEEEIYYSKGDNIN